MKDIKPKERMLLHIIRDKCILIRIAYKEFSQMFMKIVFDKKYKESYKEHLIKENLLFNILVHSRLISRIFEKNKNLKEILNINNNDIKYICNDEPIKIRNHYEHIEERINLFYDLKKNKHNESYIKGYTFDGKISFSIDDFSKDKYGINKTNRKVYIDDLINEIKKINEKINKKLNLKDIKI